MTITDQIAVNARDDHYCFGCGALNPNGLHLKFFPTPGQSGVWASFTPERIHEGFTGMVHGGIITTLLDEAMGWAVYAQEIWAVTGRLAVEFRAPVEIGVETVVSGQIASDRGRALDVTGELRRRDDDRLLARATATFVRVPEAKASEWRARYLGGSTQRS
jgi:acyl-coenzyme A thioesterase PaaI-like protein